MSHATTLIRAEGEKLFTVGQELALVRAQYARAPGAEMRRRLVRLLLLEEHFDEVIALLAGRDDPTFADQVMLSQAYLAIETEVASISCGECGARALALAENDRERAVALAIRGKAETRLGQPEAARATLIEALQLDPANKDACKRIAALDLAAGATDEVLALTDDLLERGGGHARLFAARALAQARAGDGAAARETMATHLHYREVLPPPPGWDSIEAFNAALAAELLAHPGMRWERYGSASEATWRIEAPARPDTPLFRALIDQIIAAIGRAGTIAAQSDHPWAATRPDEAFLRNWCVITESEGYETWHVHQFGWLSGVYYVQIPDSIAHGTDQAGCIAFGLPDDLAGAEGSASFGEEIVRPQPGLFMAFPSHSYHRTYPHGSRERRICVAFDVRPL